jgi:RNA 2',3'-cyclic 3'-phosphodiesterase
VVRGKNKKSKFKGKIVMLRLFISVNCDNTVKNQLLTVQEKIKTQSVKGNFSLPENLHLTLVFIGETPADEVQSLTSAINKALRPQITPFSLTFSTTGCFKHSNKELWWIGAERNDVHIETLKTIRRRITEELLSKGISFDNRAFNPHITLGREISHESPIIIPKQEIIYPVNRISLMKSERVKGKLTYTEIFGLNLEDK